MFRRMAGHSSAAHKIMKTLQVGEYDGPASGEKKKSVLKDGSGNSGGGGIPMGLIMFAVVVVAIAGYFIMGKSG
jgi:hypothetical protein